MKRTLAAAILAVGLLPNAMFSQTEQIKPPVAKKDPKVLKIHGYEIVDNYAWLRDRSDKKNPEIVTRMIETGHTRGKIVLRVVE